MGTPLEIGSPRRVEEIMNLVHRLRPHALPDCSHLSFDELLELLYELNHEQKRIDRLVDLVDELVADLDPENARLAEEWVADREPADAMAGASA